MDEKNGVFLSAFTDGSNDPNQMEGKMSSSKVLSISSYLLCSHICYPKILILVSIGVHVNIFF